MQEEKSINQFEYFDRPRLKKIYLIKSNKGNYCVRVHTLDRDSLTIITAQLYLTVETLRIVYDMIMAYNI